jgi:hypothetical protein
VHGHQVHVGLDAHGLKPVSVTVIERAMGDDAGGPGG